MVRDVLADNPVRDFVGDGVMEWPQWVWLISNGLAVLLGIIFHGVPRTGTHNGFIMIVLFIISYSVLWAGGFFPWP